MTVHVHEDKHGGTGTGVVISLDAAEAEKLFQTLRATLPGGRMKDLAIYSERAVVCAAAMNAAVHAIDVKIAVLDHPTLAELLSLKDAVSAAHDESVRLSHVLGNLLDTARTVFNRFQNAKPAGGGTEAA